MNEPILIFETDPLLGTPRLQAVNGAAGHWNPTDLRDLDEQLHARYEGLVRAGAGTIECRGRTLHVKKKTGDTSRQPTLELWIDKIPQSGTPAVGPSTAPPSAVAWGPEFVVEIDRLLTSAEGKGILPVEKAMLQLVRDELKGIVDQTPPGQVALLILVSILMTAEHLCRTQRPQEPHPYTYALSGVEWLLAQMEPPSQTPWGRLPAAPNIKPPPSWLGRFWNRVTGKCVKPGPGPGCGTGR